MGLIAWQMGAPPSGPRSPPPPGGYPPPPPLPPPLPTDPPGDRQRTTGEELRHQEALRFWRPRCNLRRNRRRLLAKLAEQRQLRVYLDFVQAVAAARRGLGESEAVVASWVATWET